MSELYSDSNQTHWKVGVITLFCLAVLIGGYAWFRDWLDNKDYTRMTVWFENANGIEPGDDVAVNGVKVGRVEHLQVVRDGVLIQFKAQLQEPLMAGTAFVLKESNLMGDKIVEIVPGNGEAELSFSPPPRGQVRTGLSGFIARVDDLVHRIEGLLSDVSCESGLLASLQGAADSTRALAGSLNAAVRENRSPLHATISNLAATTRETSRYLRQNGPVDSTLAALPGIADDASSTLRQLDAAATELEALALAIRQGDGTAGRLIHDDELYEKLLNTTSHIDSLLIDIKRDPKRYFELKVF